MVNALESQGCHILHRPSPTQAPFRITFETPEGERMGIVAYAFLANNRTTKNRPSDEHRFQIKYGGDLTGLHNFWQDPFGLYTTIVVGINPELGIFVAVDPVLHSPTRFSVSVEFKDSHIDSIRRDKWCAWERERRAGEPNAHKKRATRILSEEGDPLFEVLVGGVPEQFLRLVRFEREAFSEAPGERHFIADHFAENGPANNSTRRISAPPDVASDRIHALAREFALPESKVLDLIAERRMLKMAVRGSVAEEHLIDVLRTVPGVLKCERLLDDRGPDVEVLYGSIRLTVECKNSSRVRTAEGYEKIDFQRTRAAKSDPCSRYYKPEEFDLVAACVHAVTERWEFKFAPTQELDPHRACEGRLSSNVRLDRRWTVDAAIAMQRAVEARTR